MISLEEVVLLAKEVEGEDPIDWSSLNISKENAYRLIGANVLEMFNKRDDDTFLAMTATITKLTVENFALNLRLLQGKEE